MTSKQRSKRGSERKPSVLLATTGTSANRDSSKYKGPGAGVCLMCLTACTPIGQGGLCGWNKLREGKKQRRWGSG